MFNSDDHRFMARAIQLAETPMCSPHPNPRVGCVLVKDGAVVGEGYHALAGQAHAEVNALNMAGEQARGATAYVTLEPCCHHGKTPPCTQALIAAGVSEVVVAMTDPNPQVAGNGIAELKQAGITVREGLMTEQAQLLNRGFVKRMSTGRPWVMCKVAMSLDGRTAMATGESHWITAPTARRDVQRLRARSSAIMSGIGTVLSDNPYLNLRENELGEEPTTQPARIILDSELRTPPDARMFELSGRTLIFCTSRNTEKKAALEQRGAEVYVLPDYQGGVDLNALMDKLGQLEINEVMMEAGAILNGAMLRAKLLDELIIYMAPVLMGDAAAGMMHLPGVISMEQKIPMEIVDIRAIGQDWRITCRPGKR
ncbi:MAG: bifunctional diaminohydroxyphosphoribosylaminopyrimidine deaminase/5-amino-6-(5-phosphoribosylamino)uracil reductase RibD [Gammaproteobacteria bacterium]|nr:bifunctional diaminohydroxyphosphoribosylaminopyrimidine deaminase/5-amino-6-(5-phosphoribosylamino)uracil reductase RibD [Gammaproteobacteria bacterium]